MKVIKFFSIFLILYCQPVFTYSILIDISEQRLYLKKNDSTVIKSYSISSSFLGEGQVENSFKTPLGNHIIAKKIGENADVGTIFKERVNTGRIASIIKEKKDIADDVITSRIMWLEGIDHGYNKGGNVDSFNRFIYIHGTAEEGLIGSKASHGCIRMFNDDVIELFKLVNKGTKVNIVLWT